MEGASAKTLGAMKLYHHPACEFFEFFHFFHVVGCAEVFYYLKHAAEKVAVSLRVKFNERKYVIPRPVVPFSSPLIPRDPFALVGDEHIQRTCALVVSTGQVEFVVF